MQDTDNRLVVLVHEFMRIYRLVRLYYVYDNFNYYHHHCHC